MKGFHTYAFLREVIDSVKIGGGGGGKDGRTTQDAGFTISREVSRVCSGINDVQIS